MRRLVLPLIITVSAVVTVFGAFSPWLRSGRADRSSFQLLSLLDFLGFAPDGPMGWAVRLWPIVPLVCVIAAVAAWRGMWPIAALTGSAGGAYAFGLAFAVKTASPSSLVVARWGVTVTTIGSLALVASSLAFAGTGVHALTDDD